MKANLFQSKKCLFDTYQEKQTLKEDFRVSSLLKLKNKDEMVTGGRGKSMSFWNTKTFKWEHKVECCECRSSNGLIELPNHCVAVSGGWSSAIDIIDTDTYQLIKQIKCEGYIDDSGSCSSLHLLSNGTFLYFHNECFCQISSKKYKVLFKNQMEKEFRGNVITSTLNGKYIIIDNKNWGMSIFRVKYI